MMERQQDLKLVPLKLLQCEMGSPRARVKLWMGPGESRGLLSGEQGDLIPAAPYVVMLDRDLTYPPNAMLHQEQNQRQTCPAPRIVSQRHNPGHYPHTSR